MLFISLVESFCFPIRGYGHIELENCKKSDLGNRPMLIASECLVQAASMNQLEASGFAL